MKMLRTACLGTLLLAGSTVAAHAATFTCAAPVQLNQLTPFWDFVTVQADTAEQAAQRAPAIFRAKYPSPRITFGPIPADHCF